MGGRRGASYRGSASSLPFCVFSRLGGLHAILQRRSLPPSYRPAALGRARGWLESMRDAVAGARQPPRSPRFRWCGCRLLLWAHAGSSHTMATAANRTVLPLGPEAFGQSAWFHNIHGARLMSGDAERRVREYGLSGLRSNQASEHGRLATRKAAALPTSDDRAVRGYRLATVRDGHPPRDRALAQEVLPV